MREDRCPSSGREREQIFPLPFCSLQALNRLDNAHPHWGEWSLLSPPLQMVISSGNTFTVKTRNNVLPALWVPLSPVKATHKINHHRGLVLKIVQRNWSRVTDCSRMPELLNYSKSKDRTSAVIPLHSSAIKTSRKHQLIELSYVFRESPRI